MALSDTHLTGNQEVAGLGNNNLIMKHFLQSFSRQGAFNEYHNIFFVEK